MPAAIAPELGTVGETDAKQIIGVDIESTTPGDDEDIAMTNRATFQAIADEPDPRRQLQMLATLIASTQERAAAMTSGPIPSPAMTSTVYADAVMTGPGSRCT